MAYYLKDLQKSNNNKFIYSIITALLATSILFIFFGPLLKNPNQVYFATDHDGLQNYYGNVFHIKYDTTSLLTTGMNYPYGEMIFYTGAQLIPTSIIKFVSAHIYDISGYTIGLQNLAMLFSIVLAAILIFLVFAELGIGNLTGSIAAIAIAFLSPQIDRYGGHFSLSLSFFIPLVIYLILRFNKAPSIIKSILIGIIFFWAYTTHPYLFALNASILLGYWIWQYVNNHKNWKKHSLNLLIQLILPYLIVSYLSSVASPVTDRTLAPWGFLFYRAYPEGVFLPFGKPYGKFLSFIFPQTNYIQWEGIAYTGLVGVFAFFLILRHWFKTVILKNYRAVLTPTSNQTLNALFWGAFAALLYSFGIPFILGLEWLVNYIGPLKQLRGIGRFTWPFFYVINIMGIYFCWTLYTKKKNLLFIAIPLVMLCYDAWLNVRQRVQYYNNEIPALNDKNNDLPENSWVKQINPRDYQAIIPLPYYHLGSENVWISPTCNSLANSLIASLKTGLPTTGIYMSRTSISQSLNNIQVTREAYRKLSILNECHNKKPFLLLVSKCETISDSIYPLVKHARILYTGEKFNFYELPFQALENISASLYQNTRHEFTERTLYKMNELYSSENTLNFVYQSFDSLQNSEQPYLGEGTFAGNARNYQTVYAGPIPGYDSIRPYILSLWFGHILNDTYLRSTLIITKLDNKGKVYHEDYINIGSLAVIFDGDWALCEVPVSLDDAQHHIKITLRSEEIRKGNLVADELIIKPLTLNLYKNDNRGVIKNNRLYLKDN